MRDNEVGAVQSGQQFRRNGGKFRGIQNIQMRQAVNFNEPVPKKTVAFGWPHQPIRGLRQAAILKDGKPGGADAHARWIGRFKVYAGHNNGSEHAPGLTADQRNRMSPIPVRWHRRKNYITDTISGFF